MNDKHQGPHCAGSCEGAAYQIEIRKLRAQLDEYQRDLTDEIGVDRSQDTDWLRAGVIQRGTEIERLEAERDDHEQARTALEEMVGQLQAENEALREALREVMDRDMRNTCQHEDTHRGGAIWEICSSCGAMWADDEGGKPGWQDPPEWTKAYKALAAHDKEEK